MKKLIIFFALALIIHTSIDGQLSASVRIAKPFGVPPGTSHIFLNRSEPLELMKFNLAKVDYSVQLGLQLRYDDGPFWFMIEGMVGMISYEFEGQYVAPRTLPDSELRMSEKRIFIYTPAAIGVNLSFVQIYSGFSVTYNFDHETDLSDIPGYSQNRSSIECGWHSGFGVKLGRVMADLRYQQSFRNYGSGQYVNGQELTLLNSPAQIVISVGVEIASTTRRSSRNNLSTKKFRS